MQAISSYRGNRMHKHTHKQTHKQTGRLQYTAPQLARNVIMTSEVYSTCTYTNTMQRSDDTADRIRLSVYVFSAFPHEKSTIIVKARVSIMFRTPHHPQLRAQSLQWPQTTEQYFTPVLYPLVKIGPVLRQSPKLVLN